MSRLDRHLRRFPLLAVPVLLVALWLQISHPLLLTGHLATCAVTTACGGTCSHVDHQQADLRSAHHRAQPASDTPRDDGGTDASGHDGVHCVLCRVLQIAGKALAAVSATDLASTPLVDRAPPATALDRAPIVDLAAHGPRAPPSC